MSDHYWPTEAQIERLKPYFPCAHGVPRVDDRRVWLLLLAGQISNYSGT